MLNELNSLTEIICRETTIYGWGGGQPYGSIVYGPRQEFNHDVIAIFTRKE